MSSETTLDQGRAVIASQARQLPDTPGVYRMIDAGGEVLYVGKARALKKRVMSYTQAGRLSVRLQRMVAATASMEFVHTASEVEALLLECNYIKKFKPRFNILLRDDKSFPYILVTGDHEYPMVTKHRGSKSRKGQYFGPFAGAGHVNRVIDTLQKVFRLRNCTDHVFAHRSRPCLQYHIKRCTAPCVEMVSRDEYAQQVQDAADFLQGRSQEVQERMAAQMKVASREQRYEEAAGWRDRLQALSAIQARQDISVPGLADADVIGLNREGARSCIQVFFFRAGQNFGNRSYFPRHVEEDGDGAVMAAFMAQFYAKKEVPKQILVSYAPDDKSLLEEALTAKITKPQRGQRVDVVRFAVRNAQQALALRGAEQASQARLLEGVAGLFDLDEAPGRIEVYDNSHISGTDMVGAMVVAGPEGFQKGAYRKFNIKEAKAGDDYGMMREVLSRRFRRGLDEAASDWPDVLLIDGGKGQLSAVREALEDLGVWDALCVVAIAKGEDRNAGRETFFMEGRAPFTVSPGDEVLHYLQRLRDEAHRFAIGSHRARRTKKISASPLDDLPGVGPKRKKALLHYFGSAKAVADARVEDLERVRGVSKPLARKIYDHFHDG